MDNYIFRAMNSEFCLQGLTKEQNEDIHSLFRDLQALLSRFEADSDVCLLNQHPDCWHQVHPLTFTILQDAYTAFEHTKGLFNPFMGNFIIQLGYSKSFELLTQASHLPISRQWQPATHTVSSPVEFERSNLSIRLNTPASIDLGGYGKGWGAQLAFQHLHSIGVNTGLIDAGGDIIGWGDGWEIDIANPFDSNTSIANIEVRGLSAVATSSTIYRRWLHDDGTVAHHIIDPRTCIPANTDLVQVSVVTDNLAQSEQLAKCLLILGSTKAIDWMQQNYPQLGYILVKDNQELIIKNKRSV